MRAWEFLTESGGSEPPITLRQVNAAKRDQQWRAASHQRRIERTRPMYANAAWQREQLELERMRLKLEQIKAETEAIKSKARADDDEAISILARSSAEAKRRNEDRIQQLAQAEIHRRKKT